MFKQMILIVGVVLLYFLRVQKRNHQSLTVEWSGVEECSSSSQTRAHLFLHLLRANSIIPDRQQTCEWWWRAARNFEGDFCYAWWLRLPNMFSRALVVVSSQSKLGPGSCCWSWIPKWSEEEEDGGTDGTIIPFVVVVLVAVNRDTRHIGSTWFRLWSDRVLCILF